MPSEKLAAPIRSPYLPPLKASAKKLSVGAKLKVNNAVITNRELKAKRVIQTTKPILSNERKEKNTVTNQTQKRNLLDISKIKDTRRRSSFGDCNGSSGGEDQVDSYELRKRLNTALAENALLKAQVKKFSAENVIKTKEIIQLKASNRSLLQYRDKVAILERHLKEADIGHKRDVANLKKDIQLLKSQLASTRRTSVNLVRSKSAIDNRAAAAARNKLKAESKSNVEDIKTKSTSDLSNAKSSVNVSSLNKSKTINKSTGSIKSTPNKPKMTTPKKNVSNNARLEKNNQTDPSKGTLMVNTMPAMKSSQLLKTPNNLKPKRFTESNSKLIRNGPLKAFSKPPTHIDSIEYVQAALRGHMLRQKLDLKNSDPADDIITIQSALRNHMIHLKVLNGM